MKLVTVVVKFFFDCYAFWFLVVIFACVIAHTHNTSDGVQFKRKNLSR